MEKRYWHELSLEEQRKHIGEYLPDKFLQPPWCKYPGALDGIMGCWSLVCLSEKVVSKKEDCEKCDMYNKNWRIKDE